MESLESHLEIDITSLEIPKIGWIVDHWMGGCSGDAQGWFPETPRIFQDVYRHREGSGRWWSAIQSQIVSIEAGNNEISGGITAIRAEGKEG